ncbi:MAG: hypothetical protein A2840_01080 [Candidatus Buchananbacteria bacterium RIFCSPHIGHO2_01_FULL_47_11b]|uniref:HTH luxR-type domain-containing protein n=1 Tax=Candidatus Buchananbacteria bacterium RIFCSPHIGHO2_01_FULL_47_11b TaxID=1797537 RepID=A0A1G1Y5W5_9BACT|nr:MAG: hypothetical protein A2840_01080 [Candidatus Buchananbacteria bacterium RIFCSPHIGHO2_01_FULL_47_11b]
MKSFHLKEKLLLLRLKKKDPEAFAQLYDLYMTPIYRFIYFKVPSQQDAEDLTSEVFLKTWQYATQKDEEIENLRALLYRMARNLVIDFYRSRARQDWVNDEEAALKIPDVRQQKLLAQIEAKTELESLEGIMRQMKDEYRELLLLRYIEELSIGEIADVLQKTKGSVRVQLHRALKLSRELLESHGKRSSDR